MVGPSAMSAKPKIVVLMGGSSAEREISLKTGGQIHQALKSKDYPVSTLDLDPNIVSRLKESQCELVFIALHGSPGEDGTIQGLLETLNIPYVGSGVLASALGMDKIRSKLFFASLGIPTPFYLPVHKSELHNNSINKISDRILNSLSVPMVVKPTKAGSAIGVEIVKRRDKVKPALAKGLMEADELIVEEYIEGAEVTVGIIGNDDLRTLPIVEIVSENEFYDFEAKYNGKSRHIIPAHIPKTVAEKVNRFALAAHVGLGCRNFSRVDFIIGREDQIPYILEINTIPGMTDVSLFPDAARADGIEFPDLIETLVQLALEK